MARPWIVTPELEAKEGHWSDFAAFLKWWSEKVEDKGGPSADALSDMQTTDHLGFMSRGDIVIYAALCDAFDATGTPAAGQLFAEDV